MAKSHYDTLNVAVDASIEVIRAAYRHQIGLYHPDKVAALGSDLKALAEERAKEINAAYGILADPAKRAAYDRGLIEVPPSAAPTTPPKTARQPDPPPQPRPGPQK